MNTVLRWLRRFLILVGLTAVALTLATVTITRFRERAIELTQNWLMGRHAAKIAAAAYFPSVNADYPNPLLTLSPAQIKVAVWLAKKYKINEDAMFNLVSYAYELGKEYKLSPTLILAIIAIESNFHPYIQSAAGAQGLMQVMPKIHAKRYEAYGGKLGAFDVQINMRVGIEILLDSIQLKGGSLEEGLRFYFGGDAATDINGHGYVVKVLAEQQRLDAIAAGQTLSEPLTP